MSQAPNKADPVGSKPAVAREEEVRFAVVMYGGVSLAIYINGVAQELFNMVCATAPETRNGLVARLGSAELKSSQRVYRKLGQYVQQWQTLHANRGTLQDQAAEDYAALSAKLEAKCTDAYDSPNDPIRTRFIVDVLSGTSAGGINSIYLAKALANTQGLEGIKKLWISAGDMATLINDHLSVADIPGMTVSQPPRSLLNSQRMYRKLLDALAGMRNEKVGNSSPPVDPKAPEGKDSPLVDELDLFLTTTDIHGLTLPITLTDKVTYEKRHRNVFHFRYAEGGAENDFVMANDPFLAYAARCTSSFPFAFEPMTLSDIDAVSHPAYPGLSSSNSRWRKFYSEYWRSSLLEVEHARRKTPGVLAKADIEEAQANLQKQFLTRAFGDGGYLDNKPFSYATSMLMRRRAEVPVRRKLLYVEPVPKHPELETDKPVKPDFAENIRAAVLDLPGKEMIREDLERVLDRNRLLKRVSAYARDVDADVSLIRNFQAEEERQAQPISVLLNRYGIAYGAYHRLRIDDTSARLATALSRVAGFDPRSSACLAVRELVIAWREDRYKAESEDMNRLETRFLYDFDLQFPLRRLAFISRRINELSRLDGGSKRLLETWWASASANPSESARELALYISDLEWGTAFRAELSKQKKIISDDRAAWRALDESVSRQKIQDLGQALNIDWEQLTDILELAPAARKAKLSGVVKDNTKFDAVAAFIKDARKQLGLRFDAQTDYADLRDPASVARACIAFYFRRYGLYDMVTFPVQYGTDSTEANEIEVFRISPEDATLMIDEGSDTRRKLAGTAVMNFGAFLEESWRRNDMLWGRLDAVERIICAVMPVDKGDAVACDLRDSLVREAQEAILKEDISLKDREILDTTLVRYLGAGLPAFPDKGSQLAALKEHLKGRHLSLAMQSVIQSCLNNEGKLWQYYRDYYAVDRRYDTEQAVRSIARATAVTARMLQALARDYRVNDKPFALLAMFGSMFWGMVEAAVPNSLWNLLWRHWIGVAYIVDIAVIGGGLLLGRTDLTKFGWIALAATIGIHAAVTIIGYYIGGPAKRWIWALPKLLLKVAVAGLIAGGVLFYVQRAQGLFEEVAVHEEKIFYITAGVILVTLFVRDLYAVLKQYGKRFKGNRP